MQLSEKIETFSQVCIAFFESPLNFKHFEKKNEPHGSSISEVIDSERRAHLKTGLVSENPLAVNMLMSPKNC